MIEHAKEQVELSRSILKLVLPGTHFSEIFGPTLKNLSHKRNTTSVQTPILGKRILLADKSDDYVLYHIAIDIAKFSNCCSMLVFPFRRTRQRSYVLSCDVFSDVILYPHVLQQLQGLKTI